MNSGRAKAFGVLLLFLLSAVSVSPQDGYCPSEAAGFCPTDGKSCLIYFYGRECPVCAKTTPYIKEVEAKYADKIRVHYLEVYHNTTNQRLYQEYMAKKGVPIKKRGVPVAALGDKYFMGLSQIIENLEPEILAKCGTPLKCPLADDEGCLLQDLDSGDVNPPFKVDVSVPLILAAGLVDGINPCAFAVLIFLLAFLMQVSSSRKRMIRAGAVYITVVYVTYFLAGMGFLSAVQLTGLMQPVMKLAAAVAIVAGLINIKDYFAYGRGVSLAIPEKYKEAITSLVYKANLPAAAALGFIVSMVELPCTGGVYVAILALLANNLTRTKAAMYLLLYNFMFVLPLLIILALVLTGMKAEQLERWREGKKRWMRLALGVFLLALGASMLGGWWI